MKPLLRGAYYVGATTVGLYLLAGIVIFTSYNWLAEKHEIGHA